MFLKIVPASKVGSAVNVMECDRIDYQVETGLAEDARREVQGFLNPNCDPDDDTPVKRIEIGYTRAVMEPIRDTIAYVLITAYRGEQPPILIGAYESAVYLMNDKGVTVDRIDARHKFD